MTRSVVKQRGIVLIVDDEPASLRLLGQALEHAGYAALVATSGAEAIERLYHVRPDIILMDGVMPEVDGFEATRTIKANPLWASIPILFMTGLAEAAHAVAAFRLGGVDYVRKPVLLDELVARVDMHVERGRTLEIAVAGLQSIHGAILATDLAGRLIWHSPSATRFLDRSDAELASGADLLSSALAIMVQRLRDPSDQGPQPVQVELTGRTVELAPLGRHDGDRMLFRLSEISPDADVARLREQLKLTSREAEVLLWISYGKPNRVIGEVLGISPRTVHKHLERIFDKVGVETRSAAAATAIRVMTG